MSSGPLETSGDAVRVKTNQSLLALAASTCVANWLLYKKV